MLKRFICVIMALFVSYPLLACNLFTHNYERDYQQVVAVISPISETAKGTTFNYAGKSIYKHELVNLLNSNYSSYMQQNPNESMQSAVEYFVNQLVTRELVVLDVDRQITFGEMEWKGFFNPLETDFDLYTVDENDQDNDYTDSNSVVKSIYESIDSTLKSIKSTIITEWDYDAAEFPEATEGETSTTYPLPPSEQDDEDDDTDEIESPFVPDKAKWPGYYGNAKERSLGEETMRRFLKQIRGSVADNYTVSASDKAKFERDDREINNIIKNDGISHVYPMLYKTHYIQFLVGRSAIDNVKVQKIQASFEDNITVTPTLVAERYAAMLGEQTTLYSNDISAYNAAMKAGSETVLYHPSSNYFYVKHILLPFSDAQTAALNTFKNDFSSPNQFAVEKFRRQLVDSMVVYPHVNGEDDTSKPRTVQQVFNEVKATMAQVKGHPQAAERTFDSLIYKYNTDSGIFGNAKGYIEAFELPAGDTETYMPEFAKAARDLYKNNKVGDVGAEYAITDYGVHIMYFANRINASASNPYVLKLTDFETPGNFRTIYEIIEEAEKNALAETAYLNWQQKTINIYKNEKKKIETIEKAYKDLYEA